MGFLSSIELLVNAFRHNANEVGISAIALNPASDDDFKEIIMGGIFDSSDEPNGSWEAGYPASDGDFKEISMGGIKDSSDTMSTGLSTGLSHQTIY